MVDPGSLQLDALCNMPPSGSVLIGSPVFRKAAFGTNHPLSIQRVETVFELVSCLGWGDAGSYLQCQAAPIDAILKYHDPVYVEALQRAELDGLVQPRDRNQFNFGNMENPWFPGRARRHDGRWINSGRADRVGWRHGIPSVRRYAPWLT